MDPVIAFLLKQLLDKLTGDNMANDDAEAYYAQLRPVYDDARRQGVDVAKLTGLIRSADSGNGTLAEVVRRLREEFK